ncbi:unnamed protein product [Closterium sp. NIES-54]
MRERFWRDLEVLRLHSDRGGEFSSCLLAEFCRDEGIDQSFTLPASLQQNGIAERPIGLIMEPLSLPETAPTLRWTGEVGDASAFRVWGALSLVRDTTASKLSPRTLHCTFLDFPTDAPPSQFYHPHSCRVLSSQDVTFDEYVCFYRLHLHASHPVPLAPLFLIPVPLLVDPLPPQILAPSGVSRVDPLPLVEPLVISSDTSGPAEGDDPAADDTATTRRSPRLETPPGFPPRSSSPPLQPVDVDTGAVGGGDTGGEDAGGAGLGGAETGGAGPGGAETGSEGSGGADSGGADSGGAASPSGGGAVVRRGRSGAGAWSFTTPRAAGTGGAGGAGAAGGGGAGGTGGSGGAGTTGTRGAGAGGTGGVGAAGAGGAGARGTGGAGAAGPGGARTRGAGAAGASGAAGAGGTGGATGGAGGTAGAGGAGAAGAGGAGAGGAGTTDGTGTAPRRPFFYPQPQSSLPPPESVLRQTRACTPVRARHIACPRPPAVPGTHVMALRPSSVPRRDVLPKPPASSLLHVPDPESDLACAASPTVTRLLPTVVTDPDLESTAAFA